MSYYEGEKPFRSFKYRLKRELLKYIWIGAIRVSTVEPTVPCHVVIGGWCLFLSRNILLKNNGSTKTTVQVADNANTKTNVQSAQWFGRLRPSTWFRVPIPPWVFELLLFPTFSLTRWLRTGNQAIPTVSYLIKNAAFSNKFLAVA